MRLLKSPRARKRRKKPATSAVRLVAGLRNPGAGYEGTRHNVGFEAVDRFAVRSGEQFARGPSRIKGMMAQIGAGDDRTLLFVPNTFMNESGEAVRSALVYNKIPAEDLLAVHDDIDLDFGRLRLQVGGGSGGHNGIRSIERSLGTNDFSRLKIGVGRPPGSMDPADYVLRRFAKAEREEMDLVLEDATDVIGAWLDDRVRAQEMAALRGRGA